MKKIDEKKLYDVIIIGGGPAGLTAALYLARAKFRVAVLEGDKVGGKITSTHELVNYPGVETTTGEALTATMHKQARSFGAEFIMAEAISLDWSENIKTVDTSVGEIYAFGVLIATGAHSQAAGFKGEARFKGRGVATCATCDGEFFTGADVFVVGDTKDAAEESVFLTKFAKSVTVLLPGEGFKASADLAKGVEENENIKILTDIQVDEVMGEETLTALRYHNVKTNEETIYRPAEGGSFGVFVYSGDKPGTAVIKELVKLDEKGYVLVDSGMQTSLEGLYAAGDVCQKSLRQVATAVGDGATASYGLRQYAAAMRKETGIIPKQAEKQAPKEETARAQAPVAENGHKEAKTSSFFDDNMLTQLNAIFARMETPLALKLYLNDSDAAKELKGYMEALAELTDMLKCEIGDPTGEDTPCVKIFRGDGSYTGLAFHGVPGGHEFTSFVLGLYNASGEGQAVSDEVKETVKSIDKTVDMKILVSLSCTMCPELVTAAQKLASMNVNVSAEVYDLNHFPKLREKYKVMSVPCLVINDEDISFGKKNAEQLLTLMREKNII